MNASNQAASPQPEPKGVSGRLLDGLTRLQIRRPGLMVLIGLIITAACVPLVMKLRIDARMVALLPEDRQSVQDLDAASERIRSSRALTVAAESAAGDTESLRRFIDALAERLRTIPEATIGRVDSDMRDYQAFATEYAHLYAPLDELQRLESALEDEVRAERLAANPFYIDLEDEPEEGEEEVGLEELIERLEARASEQQERYPDGYYQTPDGKMVVLFVRTEYADEGRSSGEVMAEVREAIDALDPSSFGDDVVVSFAGDIIIQGEEQASITSELGTALALTLGGVALIVLLFFRRFRSLPLLVFGLVPGTMVSFALASYTVGVLNLTTAFLGSVLLGNGINPSIIWLARYFEERRDGHSPEDALRKTHQTVARATFVASMAAAAAYASLMVTDFRGFHDFGVIGGIGMVLSWVSALLLLPPLALIFDRIRPLRLKSEGAPRLTAPFVWLIDRAPKAVLAVSVLLVAASLYFVGSAAAADPIEYDFRQLRSVRDDGPTEAARINRLVNAMFNSTQQGRGVAMLGRNEADMDRIRAELDARIGEGEVYRGYVSILDLLPKDLEAKRPLLQHLRELLLEVRPRADDERRALIDAHLPPETLVVPTIDDLPASATRLFTERDGRRGLALVVEEAEAESIWDGRYLVRWTETLREIELEDGSRPLLVGNAPVFADMIDAVYEDMPRAIGAALLVTVLLALFGFRRTRDRILALSSLLIGVLWMAASMVLAGMKLHFLNFIAFPITFGNGVDYSVNVLRRFDVEGSAELNAGEAQGDEQAMQTAVRESGGAVLLCSLTTIIGYASLFASTNLAMNSFGLAMVISEITCFAAAILTIPAFVIWRARRAQ